MDNARISVGGKEHSAKIYLTKTFDNFKKIEVKYAQRFKKILSNFSEIKFIKI